MTHRPPTVRGLGGLPLIGHALPLLRDPLGLLRDAYAQNGPVFALHAPGRHFVVLAGAEANRFVQKEGKDALSNGPFWNRLLEREHGASHMIVALDGPDHLAQRGIYGDVLSRRAVEEHRATADARVRETLAGAVGGTPMELNAVTRLLVARLVHHVTTGEPDPIAEPVAKSMIEAFRWEANALLLGKWPALALHLPPYRKNRAVWDAFIADLVEREIDGDQPASEGWFARVRGVRDRFPDSFGSDDVRIAAALPFLAGVDTVGATLAFALYELYSRPGLHAQVMAEVDAAYAAADGQPDIGALRGSAHLSGLVYECLRLYPAAFAMYRTAARDFEFGGFTIRKGQDVLVFTSADHFNAEQFPDPMRLDVGRQARGEYRGRGFAPYGAGPHICLGAGMGEALLHLLVAAMVRHFDVRLLGASGRPTIIYDPSLTLSHHHRIQVMAARSQHLASA